MTCFRALVQVESVHLLTHCHIRLLERKLNSWQKLPPALIKVSLKHVTIFTSIQRYQIDPSLLRHSPTNYLLSGIGDTLAKWYEIRRRLNVPEAAGAILDIARRTIEISKERTLVIRDLDTIDDDTFKNLLDTIFLVAASVDGFASSRGRSVAAHSFHNGYLKVNHHPTKTHGEIVALGVLVQLAIEHETDDRSTHHVVFASLATLRRCH